MIFLKHVFLIDICYSESEPGVFGPTLAPALYPKCSCIFWLLDTKKAAASGSNFETSIRLTVEADADIKISHLSLNVPIIYREQHCSG